MTEPQIEPQVEAPSPEAAAALFGALAAVQAELPEVKKTRTAKVEKDGRLLYTYDYADLADVSLAILPLLGKHGLAFTSFPGHWPDGKFGLRYQLLHKQGATLGGFYKIDDTGGMQMVGGRITYARRHILCAVTGVAAEDDVDAREDGHARPNTARRQTPAAGRDQQPTGTAQRRTSPPPAPAATPPAATASDRAGGDLPPLPGEEDPTGAPDAPASASTGAPASGETAPPDETDYDTPGTVTTPQITAIWTVLSQVFGFTREEKEQARIVCGHITGHDLESTKNLSKNEAKAILDTLSHWQQQAEHQGEHPRDYLIVMLAQGAEADRDGD